MSEASLVEQAQEAIGSQEKVLAAGVFQPRGTSGAMTGGFGVGGAAGKIGEAVLGAAGVMGGRVLSEVEDIPRWTLIAVTPTHLHAFHAHGFGPAFRIGEPLARWRRDKIAFTIHGRVGVRTFEVEDLETGHTYEFETPRFGAVHGAVVLNLLQQEEEHDSGSQ
jgi:hypothetical protein